MEHQHHAPTTHTVIIMQAQQAQMDFLNLIEVEERARKVMDKQAYDYYSGGA